MQLKRMYGFCQEDKCSHQLMSANLFNTGKHDCCLFEQKSWQIEGKLFNIGHYLSLRNIVPHFNCAIDPFVVDHLYYVLSSTGRSWDVSNMMVSALSGGTLNGVYEIYHMNNPGEKYIFRIYLSNVKETFWYNKEMLSSHFDRQFETRVMQKLYLNGLSSKLCATFENGYCYKYVSGKTLNQHMVQNAKIKQKIAEAVGRMHAIELNCKNGVSAPQWGFDVTTVPPVLQFLLSQMHLKNDSSLTEKLQTYQKLIVDLENDCNELAKLVPRTSEDNTVLCHNDLSLSNIVVEQKDSKILIKFVDLEQAKHGHRSFDIASHFTNFGEEQNDYNIEAYPTYKTQCNWIRRYLLAYHLKRGSAAASETERMIQQILNEVKIFTLIRHLQAIIHASTMVLQRHNSSGQLQITIQHLRAFHLQKHLAFNKEALCDKTIRSF